MSAAQFVDTLPDIETLRRRCQSLAVIDAILCPEWQYRYFSFNASWAQNEMLGSMRNGEGDDWQILFCPAGAIIKGFVHSSAMAAKCPWPGVLDAVPEELERGIQVFPIDQTTFCLWRETADTQWKVGDIDYPSEYNPDGADILLPFLDGNPETYRQWGEEYYGGRLNPQALEHIYQHAPLNPFVVKSLNKEVQLDEVREEVQEMGYPVY